MVSEKPYLSIKFHTKISNLKYSINMPTSKEMILHWKIIILAWNRAELSLKVKSIEPRKRANRERNSLAQEKEQRVLSCLGRDEVAQIVLPRKCHGEELYCPGKCPRRNVPLKSMLKLAFLSIKTVLHWKEHVKICTTLPIRARKFFD